ncbi:hypothetical protein F5Y11DRAFT_328824 [Daldinia sp. FL1419]|nr:hypothetical protein F5Y11DRAFT_328824 [Daldinia sp. FL1419]
MRMGCKLDEMYACLGRGDAYRLVLFFFIFLDVLGFIVSRTMQEDVVVVAMDCFVMFCFALLSYPFVSIVSHRILTHCRPLPGFVVLRCVGYLGR